MKATCDVIGRVVRSTRGHDCGRYYVITSQPIGHTVSVCDGKYRTLNKPKSKNIKHLIAHPILIDLNAKGASGSLFNDSDLRRELSIIQERIQYSLPGAIALEKEECAFVQK